MRLANPRDNAHNRYKINRQISVIRTPLCVAHRAHSISNRCGLRLTAASLLSGGSEGSIVARPQSRRWRAAPSNPALCSRSAPSGPPTLPPIGAARPNETPRPAPASSADWHPVGCEKRKVRSNSDQRPSVSKSMEKSSSKRFDLVMERRARWIVSSCSCPAPRVPSM